MEVLFAVGFYTFHCSYCRCGQKFDALSSFFYRSVVDSVQVEKLP